MILCGLAKAIAQHSLTGLNIPIFYDGFFNISYCHYNQYRKLENNYKTLFWKCQHFFKKSKRTHMLGPSHPPSVRKYNLLDTELNSLFGGADYVFYCFRQTHTLYKNKMDPKSIKSCQCSLERYHAVLTKINPEFWSRPSRF